MVSLRSRHGWKAWRLPDIRMRKLRCHGKKEGGNEEVCETGEKYVASKTGDKARYICGVCRVACGVRQYGVNVVRVVSLWPCHGRSMPYDPVQALWQKGYPGQGSRETRYIECGVCALAVALWQGFTDGYYMVSLRSRHGRAKRRLPDKQMRTMHEAKGGDPGSSDDKGTTKCCIDDNSSS